MREKKGLILCLMVRRKNDVRPLRKNNGLIVPRHRNVEGVFGRGVDRRGLKWRNREWEHVGLERKWNRNELEKGKGCDSKSPKKVPREMRGNQMGEKQFMRESEKP